MRNLTLSIDLIQPSLDHANPAVLVRQLRHAADRMSRLAADLDALCDGTTYDNGCGHEVQGVKLTRRNPDDRHPSMLTVELSRDERPAIPADVDVDDPSSYVGVALPDLLGGRDEGWFRETITVTRLVNDFDGEPCGAIRWSRWPDNDDETIGSFGENSALRLAAECFNRHNEHLRDMREWSGR